MTPFSTVSWYPFLVLLERGTVWSPMAQLPPSYIGNMEFGVGKLWGWLAASLLGLLHPCSSLGLSFLSCHLSVTKTHVPGPNKARYNVCKTLGTMLLTEVWKEDTNVMLAGACPPPPIPRITDWPSHLLDIRFVCVCTFISTACLKNNSLRDSLNEEQVSRNYRHFRPPLYHPHRPAPPPCDFEYKGFPVPGKLSSVLVLKWSRPRNP